MRRRLEATAPGRLQRLDLFDELLFILGNHLFELVIQLQRPTQVEKVFAPPITAEMFGDLRFALFAAPVPQSGQLFGISLPGHNGPDDGHAGLAGYVGDRPVHLYIHLVKSLLHPLHRTRACVHQIGHLPLHRAQRTDRFGRPERSAQQSATVQQLVPLAVDHVSLAPRHPAELARVHQHYFQTARFQKLVQRDPVDSRALHRHRFNCLLDQPVGQPMQLGGGAAEYLHIDFAVLPSRSAYPMLLRSQIDPRAVRPDHRTGLYRPYLPFCSALVLFRCHDIFPFPFSLILWHWLRPEVAVKSGF